MSIWDKMIPQMTDAIKNDQKFETEKKVIEDQKKVEARRLREKQIRMLRSNYRNPMLLNSPRGIDLGMGMGLGSTSGLPTKLGG